MAFISLDRKIFNHFLWTEGRPFSKFEAWIDLIQLISYKEKNSQLINGVLIKWKRGQYPVSYSFLANRWVWSTNRVRGYMRLLKNHKQITTESTSIITILTLCNYEQYNSRQQTKGQTKGQAEGQEQGQADNKRTAGIQLKKEREQFKKGEQERKKANKSPDFIDQILDIFVEEHGSYEIMAKGKERSAIGIILKKYKSKYPAATSEETLKGLREYFKMCVNVPDVWLMNNMSPSIIVSKFNEINKILKNGTGKKTGATPYDIAEAVAKNFAVDFEEHVK